MEETVEKKPNNESVIRKKKKPIHQPEEPQQNHCPQINKDETLNKNSELKVETSENGNNAGNLQSLIKTINTKICIFMMTTGPAFFVSFRIIQY